MDDAHSEISSKEECPTTSDSGEKSAVKELTETKEGITNVNRVEEAVSSSESIENVQNSSKEEKKGRFSKLLSKVAEITLGGSAEDRKNKQDVILAQEAEEFSKGVSPYRLKTETADMFEKLGDYAKLEVEGSLSELKCLEQMNRVTAAKYSEMLSTAEGLKAFQEGLFKKYDELSPVFAEIDKLEKSVLEFERITELLDQYSKRLDEKSLVVMKQRHNALDKLQK
mmetsp:Transcript_16042/g.18152  ORF Transcript_16042/g.18152 Transcript_16042/m.18152 type:complete len:226 (-) Transcript_16042:1196-1873(-)